MKELLNNKSISLLIPIILIDISYIIILIDIIYFKDLKNSFK